MVARSTRGSLGVVARTLLALSVLVLALPSAAGRLALVEERVNHADGFDALDYPLGMAVSPDDAHLYVASYFGHSLTVFRREASTGRLAFVEEHVDGINFVDGLGFARDVVASPDGRHVYAFGRDELGVFARDAGTGRLAFVESIRDGVGPFVGFDGLERPAISHDGAHLYVPARSGGTFSVLAREVGTGRLAHVQTIVAALEAPCAVGAFGAAVSPDDRHVYLASRVADALCVFLRDPASGALTLVGEARDGVDGVVGLDGAHAVAVSGDGRHVYATGLDADRLVVFDRDAATGLLTPNAVYGGSLMRSPTHVAESPDGTRVFVQAAGSSTLTLYDRDPESGTLVFAERRAWPIPGGLPALDDAEELALSHDGRHVYVAGRSQDRIGVFSLAPFAFAGFLQDGSGPVQDALLAPQDLAISPDGRHAYVAGRDADAIAILEIDAAQERLVYLGAKRNGELEPENGLAITGLARARGVTVSPDGQQVYAVSLSGDAVVWFDRRSDGTLVYRDTCCLSNGFGTGGAVGARQVAVSPDGLHLYLTAHDAGTVKGFHRDPATGALAPIDETIAPFLGSGSNLLARANGITFDPTGDRLHVTTTMEGGWIVTFSRDVATGVLTLEDANATDSSNRAPLVTRDGERLLIAYESFDCLGELELDPGTGLPGQGGVIVCQNGEPGSDLAGLAEPFGLALSPEEDYLVGVGRLDGGLAIFAQEPTTGDFALAQTELDGVAGVGGLAGARDAAFTPDGRLLLVAGEGIDGDPGGVALFVPEPRLALGLWSGIALLAARARRVRRARRAGRGGSAVLRGALALVRGALTQVFAALALALATLSRALAALSLALAALSLTPGTAAASDGVLEINQTCAFQTGCFPGDDPGLPVTIGQSGSYRLTSNLHRNGRGDLDVDFVSIEADDVSLDLGGFALSCLTFTLDFGGDQTCTGTSSGIRAASGREGVRVRNGAVRGMPGSGVSLGAQSHVVDLVVRGSGVTGIFVGEGSSVEGCAVRESGFDGIATGHAAVVERSTAVANGRYGIRTGEGAVVSASTARGNGEHGLFAGRGSTIRGNAAHQNGLSGILALTGTTVVENSARGNGGAGIEAEGGTSIRANTVSGNAAQEILLLGSTAGYGDNVVSGSPTISGGRNAGGNVCNGSTTCP